MFWDFRIIKRKINGKIFYQVHRIFYEDAFKRKITLIEELPASLVGTEPKGMLQDIDLMVNAFDYPVIYIPEWNVG